MILGGFGHPESVQRLNISVHGITHMTDGPDIPYKMQEVWDGVAVDPNGLYVYVRDGNTNKGARLDIQQLTWNTLPPAKQTVAYTSTFMLNNVLYSVGGEKYAIIVPSAQYLKLGVPQSKWAWDNTSLPQAVHKASS